MDVATNGVRTRADVPDMSKEISGQTKRRKVGGGEWALYSSSFTHELNDFCKFPQASNSQGDAIIAANNESSYFNFSSHGGTSCCSSNGSAEASTDKSNPTDLEESVAIEALSITKFNSSESGETAVPLNHQGAGEKLQPESTSVTSLRRQITTEKCMPSEAELEEFFAVAEKNLGKQFADKYNYDISKDEPLSGRYEWVPLKAMNVQED